jgi:hypothetical protein
MSTMKATIARTEAAALDILTLKGAELRHAGFCAAVLPLAVRTYKHGSDREQWSGKGSAARPLRGPWAVAFALNDKGRPNSTAAARAFRAVADMLTAEFSTKRDTSDEGVELFLAAAETLVAGILAPARTAPTADEQTEREARAAAKKIESAIRNIQDAAAVLTGEQADALRAVLAAHAAASAATAPAPATAARATAKAARATAA